MKTTRMMALCGMTVLGLTIGAGALFIGDGLSAATLDALGTQAAENMQSKDSGASNTSASDLQNATGGAIIDGVGAIPVGASVPDMKMQEAGTSQAVNTFAGTQDVVMKSCTTCHTAVPICAELGKKDASQWAVTVQNMVNLGAELAPSEQAAVTAYLAGEAPNSKPLCQ